MSVEYTNQKDERSVPQMMKFLEIETIRKNCGLTSLNTLIRIMNVMLVYSNLLKKRMQQVEKKADFISDLIPLGAREKGGTMFRDLLQKYKDLSEALVNFQRHKDMLWKTTMANDKKVMQMETEVWYLNWRVKYLTKLIHKMPSIEELRQRLKDDHEEVHTTSEDVISELTKKKKKKATAKEKSNDRS